MVINMRRYAISTPKGTRDILFEECAARRETESRLASLFSARGYGEIITPALEYYDVLLESGSPITPEELYKLIDRSGRILVLRPDMTTPVARIAATKLNGRALPQRFYYVQDVFRAGELAGRGGEITQAGIELLGATGVRADTEVIAVAMEALGRVAGKFRVEIGHAGFFKALAASLGTDEAFNEELRLLIEGKNFAALNDLLAPFSDRPAYEALRRLPQLFGGEEVLDEALSLAHDCAGAEEIEYLRLILRELCAAGYGDSVMIDLGLVHHIHYYTGVVFRGYVEGAGGAVLNGGRYDGLTAVFGRAMPATGFAVDIDGVCAKPEAAQGETKRYLLHAERGYLRRATDFMDRHRPGQCELSPCETYEESAALALAKGIAYLVRIDAAGASVSDTVQPGL